MPALLERIAELAEPLRAETFVKAAEFVLALKFPVLIETGCFRGCTGDGSSTAIIALLARETRGTFASFELNGENIVKAIDYLQTLGLHEHALFIEGDSLKTLQFRGDKIDFAYLDSYDFEEHKAADAQNHQLKEVEILLPKMAQHSAFLLDDCGLPLGGKGGLSIPLILENGYKETATGYQRLFIR